MSITRRHRDQPVFTERRRLHESRRRPERVEPISGCADTEAVHADTDPAAPTRHPQRAGEPHGGGAPHLGGRPYSKYATRFGVTLRDGRPVTRRPAPGERR